METQKIITKAEMADWMARQGWGSEKTSYSQAYRGWMKLKYSDLKAEYRAIYGW